MGWAVPHSLSGVVIGDVHQRRRRTPLCCGRRLHLRRPHTCLRSQRMQVGRCTHTRKRPIPTWADPHLGRTHVARFVSGLGIGGATPIVFPYAAEAVPPKARGFYVSVGAIHAHSHAFTCAHVRTFRHASARHPIRPGPSLHTWAGPPEPIPLGPIPLGPITHGTIPLGPIPLGPIPLGPRRCRAVLAGRHNSRRGREHRRPLWRAPRSVARVCASLGGPCAGSAHPSGVRAWCVVLAA